MENDNKVSSELYEEFDYTTNSKPLINKNNSVSKFSFKLPPPVPCQDSDGDFIVSRRPEEQHDFIEIEHSKRTELNEVGLQIWRGAFLLADYLLYTGHLSNPDHYFLELGSGVGLTSIVASMFSRVFCTDINTGGLLKLIESNCKRNQRLSKYPIKVVELDFQSQTLPIEIAKAIHQIPIILAADVVYDDVITEAFLNTIQHILSHPPEKTVFVALEKRFVFTLADCDTVAPCYESFLEGLHKLEDVKAEEINCDFPQYFQYNRVKELVLWRITSIPK